MAGLRKPFPTREFALLALSRINKRSLCKQPFLLLSASLFLLGGHISKFSSNLACLLGLLLPFSILGAETVAVHDVQGTVHGFLIIRNEQGQIIATGDSIQSVHGDRVSEHLIFHFRDGSIDDETTLYTQHQEFRLISDHHIQKGPSFPQPMDMLVEANGDVTTKTTAKGGTEKVTKDHLDLPPDIANGLISIYLQNLPADSQGITVGFVIATPKPRLVTLAIQPDGVRTVHIAGIRRRATDFRIKIELGGVAGVIAPVIGKQPKDVHLWVLQGEAPVFLRESGQFYEGAPVWRIEQTTAQFDR
jgi:hypothetical protein